MPQRYSKHKSCRAPRAASSVPPRRQKAQQKLFVLTKCREGDKQKDGKSVLHVR